MIDSITAEFHRQILVDLLRVQKEDEALTVQPGVEALAQLVPGGMENLKRVIAHRERIMRTVAKMLVGIGREDMIPPELASWVK